MLFQRNPMNHPSIHQPTNQSINQELPTYLQQIKFQDARKKKRQSKRPALFFLPTKYLDSCLPNSFERILFSLKTFEKIRKNDMMIHY